MVISNDELFENAKKTFGFTSTEIPDQCERSGWLLPDGTLLNFEKNTPFPMEHSKIVKIFGDLNEYQGYTFDPNTEFMKRGAIRVNFKPEKRYDTGRLHIEMWEDQQPTIAQKRQLSQCACNLNIKEAAIDRSYIEKGLFFTDVDSVSEENCELVIKTLLHKPFQKRNKK